MCKAGLTQSVLFMCHKNLNIYRARQLLYICKSISCTPDREESSSILCILCLNIPIIHYNCNCLVATCVEQSDTGMAE